MDPFLEGLLCRLSSSALVDFPNQGCPPIPFWLVVIHCLDFSLNCASAGQGSFLSAARSAPTELSPAIHQHAITRLKHHATAVWLPSGSSAGPCEQSDRFHFPGSTILNVEGSIWLLKITCKYLWPKNIV